MKSGYLSLWLLLVVALAVVTWFSFFDVDVAFGNWHIRHSTIADLLLKPNQPDLSDAVEADPVFENKKDYVGNSGKYVVEPIDSTPKVILFFGDSMVQNLAFRMAKYAAWNGHTLHAVNWDSSNTKIWAESDTITYYINKFHPDVIFVCLGSNEVFLKYPEGHRKFVEKILNKIGDNHYIWIGPPSINGNPGITDMIQSTVKKGCYYRSTELQLERQKDHIHPTRQAAARWFDSISAWIPFSKIPFKMSVPPDSFSVRKFDLIYLKALNKQ